MEVIFEAKNISKKNTKLYVNYACGVHDTYSHMYYLCLSTEIKALCSIRHQFI